MQKIIDLSGAVENNMWGYYSLPGLEDIIPGVSVETLATVEKDDFFASKIQLSSISGTYLEAGSHILKNGKTLDEYSVADFIKPAKFIRLPYLKAKAVVGKELLEQNAPVIEPGDALIIDTGWWRQWNGPGYVLESPNFSRDALEWILAKKISILCVDVTCIESAWSEGDDSDEKGGLLGALFETGALLVAPVVNLDEIKNTHGTIYCLPLKVNGTSGAPVRTIYIEESK